MQIFYKGFNFSQDGPGNRLVYHLSGCNMHCPWCANPEGMTTRAGAQYTPEAILEECLRCRPMFFGGGGVTFTGGEATLQKNALMKVLQMLQAENIHTALETNGTSPHLLNIAAYVDYLIMDFKHYGSDMLRLHTGVGNETLKENFARLCRSGRQLHIRIPLINGFNADNPIAFVDYFAKHDTSQVVFEFLPYHEYGKSKWQTPYMVSDGFVTAETVEAFRRTFVSCGLKLIST